MNGPILDVSACEWKHILPQKDEQFHFFLIDGKMCINASHLTVICEKDAQDFSDFITLNMSLDYDESEQYYFYFFFEHCFFMGNLSMLPVYPDKCQLFGSIASIFQGHHKYDYVKNYANTINEIHSLNASLKDSKHQTDSWLVKI